MTRPRRVDGDDYRDKLMHGAAIFGEVVRERHPDPATERRMGIRGKRRPAARGSNSVVDAMLDYYARKPQPDWDMLRDYLLFVLVANDEITTETPPGPEE